MHLIDTHAHIYLEEFDADRAEVVRRAKEAGVAFIYLPNIDLASITPMMELVASEPAFCFPMMGLHPCSVDAQYDSVLDKMEALLLDGQGTFRGVGECGLDYYWDKTFIAEQKSAFTRQIRLAKRTQLPVIIHSRDALDDCIDLITAEKDASLRGIFHCFSGNAEQLQKIIDLGFYAGIGGVVTFKHGGLDKILRPEHLPYLVLETDSPYLAPVPYRGKRNEPSYLRNVITRLSEVLAISEEEIIRITGKNAVSVFG